LLASVSIRTSRANAAREGSALATSILNERTGPGDVRPLRPRAPLGLHRSSAVLHARACIGRALGSQCSNPVASRHGPEQVGCVALPANCDVKAASDHDGAMTPCHGPANCAASRDLFMVSATNGRQSTHTTSAEDWGCATFAASPTRPPANAAHADRTLNPASARPRSHSSSRRSGRSNTAARRVPPRSLNRQRAIRT